MLYAEVHRSATGFHHCPLHQEARFASDAALRFRQGCCDRTGACEGRGERMFPVRVESSRGALIWGQNPEQVGQAAEPPASGSFWFQVSVWFQFWVFLFFGGGSVKVSGFRKHP